MPASPSVMHQCYTIEVTNSNSISRKISQNQADLRVRKPEWGNVETNRNSRIKSEESRTSACMKSKISAQPLYVSFAPRHAQRSFRTSFAGQTVRPQGQGSPRFPAHPQGRQRCDDPTRRWQHSRLLPSGRTFLRSVVGVRSYGSAPPFASAARSELVPAIARLDREWHRTPSHGPAVPERV